VRNVCPFYRTEQRHVLSFTLRDGGTHSFKWLQKYHVQSHQKKEKKKEKISKRFNKSVVGKACVYYFFKMGTCTAVGLIRLHLEIPF
jgi:hypothetical protein